MTYPRHSFRVEGSLDLTGRHESRYARLLRQFLVLSKDVMQFAALCLNQYEEKGVDSEVELTEVYYGKLGKKWNAEAIPAISLIKSCRKLLRCITARFRVNTHTSQSLSGHYSSPTRNLSFKTSFYLTYPRSYSMRLWYSVDLRGQGGWVPHVRHSGRYRCPLSTRYVVFRLSKYLCVPTLLFVLRNGYSTYPLPSFRKQKVPIPAVVVIPSWHIFERPGMPSLKIWTSSLHDQKFTRSINV